MVELIDVQDVEPKGGFHLVMRVDDGRCHLLHDGIDEGGIDAGVMAPDGIPRGLHDALHLIGYELVDMAVDAVHERSCSSRLVSKRTGAERAMPKMTILCAWSTSVNGLKRWDNSSAKASLN